MRSGETSAIAAYCYMDDIGKKDFMNAKRTTLSFQPVASHLLALIRLIVLLWFAVMFVVGLGICATAAFFYTLRWCRVAAPIPIDKETVASCAIRKEGVD